MINEGLKFWLSSVKDNVEKNSSFQFEYLRRIEAILENTLACHVMGKLSGKKSGVKISWHCLYKSRKKHT